ncbi:MAG: hypothetical protein CMJ81_03385 [Planctomycetaceae bacterium]|nr:hypothetical protein [Planctomycetaceae bacterium]
MSSTESDRPTLKFQLAAGQQSDDGPGLLETPTRRLQPPRKTINRSKTRRADSRCSPSVGFSM